MISVEHAVNFIPPIYQKVFDKSSAILNTHRGIDFGAKAIAMHLAAQMPCDYFEATVSRLLIDYNRSLKHPKCFSEWTKSLSKIEKESIIQQYYLPYRKSVESCIEAHIKNNRQVFHLSMHSFTPELDGITRNAAIGLLYDPKRNAEKEIARIWHALLTNDSSDYNVRMNYPYRGTSDGFVSALRKKYAEQDYVGFEVENNQALVQEDISLTMLKNTHLKNLVDLLNVI